MTDKELLKSLAQKGANSPADFVVVVLGFISESLCHKERRTLAKHFASAFLHEELQLEQLRSTCNYHERLRQSVIELLKDLSEREPDFFLELLFSYMNRRLPWTDVNSIASYVLGAEKIVQHIEGVLQKMETNGGA